jgi:predicted nucleic acid-binding protein
MVLTYLLDSDILINHLRKKAPIQAYLGELQAAARFACSTITVAEVYAGMRPTEETATRRLIDGLVHLPVTSPVAEKAAQLQKDSRKTGHTIPLADCLIAATAILEQATLVTANTKHYPHVQDKITQPQYPFES